MKRVSCVQCGSSRLRSSRCHSWVEIAIRFAGWRMRRCPECNTRFAQCGDALMRTKRLKRIERRILLTAAAVGALAVVLAAILYFGRASSAPAEGLLLFL